MKHYVYKLTDPITKQFYIGSRSHEDPDNDDYMGSMKTWIPEDETRLVKQIIKDDFETREDAIEFESDMIKDNIDNPLNENYHIPTKGFSVQGMKKSPEEVQAMRKRLKEYYKHNKHPWYGRSHTPEAIKKMKENHADVSGKNHPLYGKVGKLNPQYGRKRTKAQKLNISNSLKGRTLDEETKLKISESHKGKKLSKEHIQAIIDGTKGRKFTKEHKKKLSDSHKRRHKENNIDYSGKNNPNSKKVIYIQTGKIFETMKEAANYNNSSVATIRNHCQKKIQNPKFKYQID